MDVASAGRSAGWRRSVEQHPALVVTVVVAVLAAPHLVTGPEIMADDWVWIRNGEFIAWWDAGGSRQAGRPGAFALYALTFGVIGPHPLALAFVQVALWAAAALSVLRCLRAFLDSRLALGVTVLWLVLPSHTTLELWASTSQAWVALILLAEGLRHVRVRPDRAWIGYVMLAAAGTFYEVVIPVVPVGLAVIDRLHTGRLRWQPLALGAALVAPSLVWSLTASTVYPDTVRGTERKFVEHAAASLAFGMPVETPIAYAIVALALVLAVLALRHVRANGWSSDTAVMLAGFAVVLAGTAFALRSYIIPDGIGNRVTAASGVGAAIFWVGVYRSRWFRAVQGPRRLAVLLMVGALALLPRITYVSDWIETSDEGIRVAGDFADEVASNEDGYLVAPGRHAVGGWTYALLDGWNSTAAVQVIADDPTLVVNATRGSGCILTGPPLDKPLAQYGSEPDRPLDECLEEPGG